MGALPALWCTAEGSRIRIEAVRGEGRTFDVFLGLTRPRGAWAVALRPDHVFEARGVPEEVARRLLSHFFIESFDERLAEIAGIVAKKAPPLDDWP